MSLLFCPSLPQLSWDVLADTGSLCDKVAVLIDKTKKAPVCPAIQRVAQICLVIQIHFSKLQTTCPLLVVGCDDYGNMEGALQVTALAMRCYESNLMDSDLMTSLIAKSILPSCKESAVYRSGVEYAICINLIERKRRGDRTCNTR